MFPIKNMRVLEQVLQVFFEKNVFSLLDCKKLSFLGDFEF